jgi:hypothetical protein
MGRPTFLTPELQDQILTAVRAGNYIETAAAHADIGPETLRDWLRRGAKESQGIYHDFSGALKKAWADAEAVDVARIAQAAAGGLKSRKTTKHQDGSTSVTEDYFLPEWTASAWRLERKFHDRWGRRERTEVKVTLTDGPAAAALVEILRRFIPEDKWDEFCGALGGDAGLEGIRQTV